MEILMIGIVFVLLALAFYLYLEIKKVKESKKQIDEYNQEINKLKESKALGEYRNGILEKVDNFLKESKFINALGLRNNEKIFQYIYKNGELYEFKEILTKSNNKIGVDSQFLCFKDLSYVRVSNPKDFIEKYSSELNTMKNGNPNETSGGLGLTSEHEVKKMILNEVQEKVS